MRNKRMKDIDELETIFTNLKVLRTSTGHIHILPKSNLNKWSEKEEDKIRSFVEENYNMCGREHRTTKQLVKPNFTTKRAKLGCGFRVYETDRKF